jgi:hypothetical protein
VFLDVGRRMLQLACRRVTKVEIGDRRTTFSAVLPINV